MQRGTPGRDAPRYAAAAPAREASPAVPRVAPGMEGLDEVLAFARRALGGQVLEVRCLERYDILCADEGRYVIRTDRGAFTAIRSRLGEITLLDREPGR